MKKHFILKFVLVCISLCISLNARTQTTAYETYLSNGIFTETAAPTGEVRFPAEFEPVQAVMVVYPLNVPYQLLQEISEDCKLITVINRKKEKLKTIDEIKTEYTNNDVTISNCEFIETKKDVIEDGLNSYWIRDFGPWYIFEDKEVAIVDNIYNRSFVDDDSNPISSPTWSNTRWRDDKFAEVYATDNNVTLYGMEVVHTGGNMMQDGRGVGVSDSIVHTQSETFVGLSNETVNQRMNDYLGIDTYHVTLDPQGDYIAHVDCWGKLLAPDKIIIARVPNGHEQYSAYEEVASYFASTNCCWGYPYKVYRVDVPVTKKSEIKAYNKIAPYTNSLILNNKVLVPISSLTSSSYNEAALAVYREAMPGYEIVGINYVIEDAEMGNYSGWKNTDALHCRTRDIMDFNMLFVDHRNVLFGEQAYKESYPITAKFIAYSGDAIKETKLHYSINDGDYQTVNMTATGNADEYAANITGYNIGDVIEYYVTGEDAFGRTCVQPQFGELEPHTFTVGEASDEEPETPVDPEPTPEPTPEPEQPAQPVLDITKYYRIKTASGTGYQYLTIFNHNEHESGSNGGVGVAILDEGNAGQMFKFEDAGNGKYYLISADSYYIYCQPWNVDAINNSQKSALWGFDSENEFELQCDKGYFKVENVSGTNYVFCNVSKETRATIANWTLEEVPLSVTVSADNNTVTVNESVQLNATAIGGTGNYTYSWSPADGLSSTTIANPTFTSATANTYTFTCTVTDNEETATSNTITITVNEAGTGGGTGSDVVTIGEINSVNFSNAPTNTYNSRSVTQQYYLSDSIKKKDGGTISTIAFHTANGDFSKNTERKLTIYMKNTSEDYFADKNMVKMDASETVFTGLVTLTPNQWITINLTNGFEYTGENILLCVHDNSGNYNEGINFKGFSSTIARCKYNHSGDNSTSPADKQYTGTTSFTIPIIQFTFKGESSTTPVAPEAPVVTATANGQNSIVLSWNAVDGATSYKVYSNGNVIATVTGTTHTVNNLQAGTNNCFSVSAVGNGGESTATEACAETEAAPVAPAAPANLTATATETTVALSWDAVDGASYNVYQGDVFVANVTETTYTVENLTANTSYTFTVKAVKDQLESDAATVTVTTLTPAPATPTNVVVTVNGQNSITITWDAVDGATDYYVYKDGQMWANTNGATTYTEKDLAAGTECCFAVKAVNGTGTLESALSETKCATTEAEQGGDDNTGGDGGNTGSDVVTIDGGKVGKDPSTANVVPIHNNFEYSFSQQYYTSNEIGRSNGTITHIAFKTADDQGQDISGNDKYPYTRTIDIYMENTDDSHFITNSIPSVAVSNLVFSGEVEFNVNSWVTIELNTPFTYNGNNVLVCVNDVTTPKSFISKGGTSFVTFDYGNSPGFKAVYKSRSSGKYTPTSSISSMSGSKNVPVVQFTFASNTTPDQPEPEKPTITVDKQRFWADNSDYVTFSVTPEDAEIWYTAGTDTYQLTDTTFKTSNAGTYSFYAKKDDLTSDPIEVVAVAENELVLTLSTNTIVANGIDEVTFSVTQNDINGAPKNVTNECTFKINGTAITGDTFFTNRAKDYTVTATKGNKTATADLTAKAVSGEENVVLIDGNVIQPAETTSVNNTVPVCNYYEYGISQQYYKASEIGKNENGIISHISFKTAKTAETYTRDIEIYIVNTDESDFGETSRATKPMSANDLVYSGEVTFTQNSWVTIELTNKFTYTANKNILVSVNDMTGEWEELSSYFDTYKKSDLFRTLYKGNSDGAFDPTDTIKDCGRIEFIPFVKFTFEKEQEVITLKANNTLIKADDTDKVTFTVTKEGLNPEVVTEESEIHILREGDQNETILNSSTGYEFTTTVAGNYTAYAMKGEAKSDTVSFRAVYPIEIIASTDTIVADNVDFVRFTVEQSTGLGSEPIDITNAATIFVDNTPLGVGVNTFKTNIIDTYYVYAKYDGITSKTVTVVAKSHINYDEDIEGSLDGEYFNPKGYVTYNKGEDNEYTLVAIKEEDSTATITEENVWYLGTGPGSMIELIRPNPHKPQDSATLIIPEKILFDDNWVTVTEIEDYAFDNLFRFDSWNDYTPGDPLNGYFTNLIIPSTIDTVGTYSFAFNVDTYVICYAPEPPVVGKYPPFLQDTYKNAILYVPAPYVDDYKAAAGWGTGTDGDKYAGFTNILPIETPTFYIAGSWDNVNNWMPKYGYPDPGEDVIILKDARIENGTVADVGRIDIIGGSITIADGGQLIHTNPGVTVTLEKEIIGYKGVTSPTSWYTISSPLYPSIEADSVENLLSNDYDLYRYDEPTHYWDNIEDLLDTIQEGPHGNWSKLDEGRGYLYANNNDVTLKFNGVANHTGGIYTLTTEVWDGVLKGFHLVGNPFTHDIYMNNAFSTEAPLASGYYILSSAGAWSANLGNDKAIEPCQGVLIKAIREGTLTINKKVGPAAQTRNKASDEFLTISVSNKNYEDKAYVLFSTEYPLEKVNHQNKDIPMVYIPMEEDNYAIATMDNDVKEIPVSFEAKTMGQYTISVKAQNYDAKEMYLVDRMTGIETNLLLEDYTFMATTTDNHERFIITMSTDVDTNENFIFINNGEMIINNIEGRGVLQIFDVMGRYISHTEVSGSANISTEEFTSGVYIIRMIDDNGIKTQKVVL